MSIISAVLVVVVAFLAGMGGILDEFQFHQPLVACTLIGLVTGNLEAGIILGGSLQMVALGWANIGAAVAPDAALASVAAAIILALGGQGVKGVDSAFAIAMPLAVAGLFLTMIARTLAVAIVHAMDRAAEAGNIRAIEMWQVVAICMQGLRIAIPATLLLMIPAESVQALLEAMPAWLNEGMASREVWPFFMLGFVIAAITQITLIGLGVIGVALALLYLQLTKNGGSAGGNSGSGDPLGDILNDY